jgi:hypothetical protein
MPTLQVKTPTGDKALMEYSLDGTTYVPFAGIQDIEGHEMTAPEIKNTDIDGDAETAQPGRPDYGSTVATLKFKKAIVTLVKGWMKNKTILFFRVTVRDKGTAEGAADSTYVFQGFVTKANMLGTLKAGELVLSKLTIKITDEDTFTEGDDGGA